MELVRKLTLRSYITLFLMIKCSLYGPYLRKFRNNNFIQPHVYNLKKNVYIKYTYYSCGFSVAKRLPIILYTDN